MKNLLVFQHIECEHPGAFRAYLKAHNVTVHTVNLNQHERIPNLEKFDALWVMGGPMDVWDTDEYPWLIEEKKAIRRWVLELNKPYLGLCLGHQLLAEALGGKCELLNTAEIGVLDIELNEIGMQDAIFRGMPKKQKCLQWHSVEVSQLPDNAVILASSSQCVNQAMRVGERAWSMQYHIEVEDDTIKNWSEVPAYWQALLNTIGEDEFEKMQTSFTDNSAEFANSSQLLYDNFIATNFPH